MDHALQEDVGKLLQDHSQFHDLAPLYARLRAEDGPVGLGGVHLLARYDDIVQTLRGDGISRQAAALAEAASLASDLDAENIQEARYASTQMLINQDGAAHKRMRSILEVAFKPSRVASWATTIQAITDELIESVAGKQAFDFMNELAFPLPERLICTLMGVPYEDHELWGKWTEICVAAGRTGEPTLEAKRAYDQAQIDFYEYFSDLLASRRKNLGEDLVSLLIRAESEGDRLNEAELSGTLQMLIQAGHETTANLINNGMYTLLQHPDQYDMLRADPSLVTNAVEEMLRYCSPSDFGLPKMAVSDLKIGNALVPKGDRVMPLSQSANRDPSIFEYPDRFDITRNTKRHIAFSVGPHFCLGNQFARLEATKMFHAIVTRLPKLKIVGQPRYKSAHTRSLTELNVAVAD